MFKFRQHRYFQNITNHKTQHIFVSLQITNICDFTPISNLASKAQCAQPLRCLLGKPQTPAKKSVHFFRQSRHFRFGYPTSCACGKDKTSTTDKNKSLPYQYDKGLFLPNSYELDMGYSAFFISFISS